MAGWLNLLWGKAILQFKKKLQVRLNLALLQVLNLCRVKYLGT